MKKKLFLVMVFACILMIEGPAFGITLNSGETATFKFDFGAETLLSNANLYYFMKVTDSSENALNWYGTWELYDELGEAPSKTGSLSNWASTFGPIAFSPAANPSYPAIWNEDLLDDPVSYLKVTFIQGAGPSSAIKEANFNVTAQFISVGDNSIRSSSVTGSVPEPASLLLLGLGLIGLAGSRKIKK